jgi:hypothetical protein
MTISRASLAPLTSGPPANTVSPADNALAVVLAPFFLTTVSLTICQVQVVPSGALITTSLSLTNWMVPRSKATVWKPVLFWKVNSPCTPPRRRSRPSAHRTRGAVAVAELLAALSSVFSSAACALPELDRAGVGAAVLLPATTTWAIPPPARKLAMVMPAPQRNHRFLRARAEKSSAVGGSAGSLP